MNYHHISHAYIAGHYSEPSLNLIMWWHLLVWFFYFYASLTIAYWTK